MRKLKKSELKRVYGGSNHTTGDSAESTESAESADTSDVT